MPLRGHAGARGEPHHEATSPGVAAFAFAVRVFVTAAIVCGLTYLLHWFDFGPIRELVTREEGAYLRLFPPGLVPDGTVNPIIFVDIDKETLNIWKPADFTSSCGQHVLPTPLAGRPNPAAGTPRWLIAEITKAMLGAGAAAIFIDIDLRSRGPDGDALDGELKCAESAKKILLPHYFETGSQLHCGSAERGPDDLAPVELDTGFDTAKPVGVAVHAVVASRGYGVIDGVCTGYEAVTGTINEAQTDASADAFAQPQFLPAAMIYAIKLANATKADAMDKLIEEPQWGEFQWLIGPGLTSLSLPEGGGANRAPRLLYARLSASQLMGTDGISVNDIDMNTRHSPIVIIGSTHPGAGDTYSTPLGLMPGALIQANIGLSLQLAPENRFSRSFNFVFEVGLLAFASAAIGWLRYKILPKLNADKEYAETTKRFFESISVASIMLIFVFVPFGFAFIFPLQRYMPIWQFGALSFILGAIALLIFEFTSHFGNWCEKRVEYYYLRWRKLGHQATGVEVTSVVVDVSVVKEP